MLDSKHGKRYLTEDEFTRYCAILNLPLRRGATLDGHHIEGDLERFERQGILLPILQKVVPGDYTAAVVQRSREATGPSVLDDPKWQDLRPLEHHQYIEPQNLTDDDLWHYLDHELDRGNPFLVRPTPGTFTPWLPAPRRHEVGSTTYQDSAVRYYHYWQAYQVYLIQKHYPLFAFQPDILTRATDQASDEWGRQMMAWHWPEPSDASLQLARDGTLLEPLSHYIWLRTQEARRSYARGETGLGYQSLSGTTLKEYDRRVADHARTIQRRFALTDAQFVEFAVHLINFHNDLVRDERMKLAAEVKDDLWYLREVMIATSGKSADELAEDIAQQGGYWAKKTFRYLDKALEMTEEAASDLAHSATEYNKQFPSQQISDVEIRSLLNFLDEHGMFIVPYTIYEGRDILGERRDFYELSRYVWMKNLSTALEDFLRKVYDLKSSLDVPSTARLDKLIRGIFPWGTDFKNMRESISDATKQHLADPSDQAIQNILDAHTRPELDKNPHIRIFLMAYWARNLTSHRHPFVNRLSHELLYGFLGGHVFGALFYCFFYTWAYGKQQGWIK